MPPRSGQAGSTAGRRLATRFLRSVSRQVRARCRTVDRKHVLGLALGLLVGCADHATGPRQATTPAAKRIYAVAEARVEDGAYGDAALLLRHALLQLPADASGDELRHALILRIAYVEMLAWSHNGNRVHLEDAQRMLLRYAERHEILFGDDAASRAARGDVYEILYEIESRLEETEAPTSAEVVAAAVPAEAPESSIGLPERRSVETSTTPPPEPTKTPRADAKTPRRAKALRAEAETPATDGGDVRHVRVRTRRGPDVDDPATRAALKSPFSNPEEPMVLTRAGLVKIHGPRPLVRLAGFPRIVERESSAEDRRLARALGRTLVQTTRTDLRECLAGAFARRPVTSAESTVELSIHPDGTITGVRIVDGGLIDGLGDVCVIERLGAAQLEAPDLVATRRLQVSLEFIYQGAVWMHEGSGRSGSGSIPAENTSTASSGFRDPKTRRHERPL